MAEKSIIHILPISLNNECSYDGCLHIMDEYVAMINRWYTKAGRGINKNFKNVIKFQESGNG